MSDTAIASGTVRKYGYAAWGLVCLIIAIVGFWPSYIAPIIGGTYTDAAAMMPLHVLSAYLWVVLIVLQPGLVLLDKLTLHRIFGLFGVLVAVSVVITGVIVQIEVMAPYSAQDDVRNSVFLPYFRLRGLLVYAICVAVAIALRNRSDWHKRLMILGTLSLLEAAYNRIFINILGLPDIAGPMAVVSHIVLMILFLTWDRFAYGRFHPLTLWGTVLISGMLIATTPIAFSEWWQVLAARLAGS